MRPLLADPDGLLDANLNEVYLMHGTSDWVIRDIIARTGFDERVANLRGLYGGGVYFACESCKSAQYAPVENGLKMLVISRVVLGNSARNSARNSAQFSENSAPPSALR